MRLPMQAFSNGGVLAGAVLGQKVFVALIEQTIAPPTPQVYYLDFTGVSVATTSFLRESVIAYRRHARGHWTNVYPVIANLVPAVREELDNFLRDQGDAFVVCEIDNQERPTKISIVGRLDGKQDLTLRAVIEQGEVDAPTLAERFKTNEPISSTAWNNRLASLSAKGLVIEIGSGRGKRYRPVLRRLRYGT